VKAMNSEGYWSGEFQYAFNIRPPWWKTWWAYTLYVLAIIGSIWYYIKWRERALKERQKVLEKTVEIRTAELVAEKKLSDDLLLNILPSEVADELKQKGSAQAKQFEEVTVMFTDFKDFTQISEKLTAVELVNEIDSCFKAFDNIISIYNIEKIKTIGDSYMCAGGLPVLNETNAQDVVNAALEIQQFIHERRLQRLSEDKTAFEIRIGIHTGTVVAGIVGVKKFAYDIWGDTVNIASRMENSGEAGKVNISGSTYELVKDKFICTYRGKINAKHKGMIDMYFVER
jgi:class 3 adenylate cyclase